MSSIQRTRRTQVAASHKYFIYRHLYKSYNFIWIHGGAYFYVIFSVDLKALVKWVTYFKHLMQLLWSPIKNEFMARVAAELLYSVRLELHKAGAAWLIPKVEYIKKVWCRYTVEFFWHHKQQLSRAGWETQQSTVVLWYWTLQSRRRGDDGRPQFVGAAAISISDLIFF